MSLREPTAAILPSRMSMAPSRRIANSRISALTRGRIGPSRVSNCEQFTSAQPFSAADLLIAMYHREYLRADSPNRYNRVHLVLFFERFSSLDGMVVLQGWPYSRGDALGSFPACTPTNFLPRSEKPAGSELTTASGAKKKP
jgi:hypothetical protein